MDQKWRVGALGVRVNPSPQFLQVAAVGLELWSAEGEMAVALVGQSDGWFERAVADGAREFEFKEYEGLPLARPSVLGLFEDARNYLWTFTALADPGRLPECTTLRAASRISFGTRRLSVRTIRVTSGCSFAKLATLRNSAPRNE